MGLIETIAIILVVLWLLGFGLHIGGSIIHVLLVIAIIVFLMRFIKRNA
ncbi:MAG TPA: lmo0937 family membrane protein [Candidatus Saccharimonadales bacterium]|nr:lmo0937 family membrane protein [Candidatus Saccharimonadales bacterium]